MIDLKMAVLKKNERLIQLIAALVIVPLAILAFIWIATPLTEKNSGYDSDGRYYGAMANSSLYDQADKAPWCWRILTPYLASVLPFSTLMNFKVLAFFSDWLSLVLLYGILQKSGYSCFLSLVGMLFYSGVFWAIKFSFYSPAYIDFQTQTFILAILFFTVIKQYWALPIFLTVGVLQKESLIFLGVVVYVDYAQEKGWFSVKSFRYLALLFAIPALVIAITHLAIIPSNDYSALNAMSHNVSKLITINFWPRFILAIFSGLGILPMVLLFKRKFVYHFLYKKPFWFLQILTGIVSLFGGVDKARLFLYMLPAIVTVFIGCLENIFSKGSNKKIYIWLIFTLSLHLYLGYHLIPMGSFDEYLNRMVPMHASKEVILPNLVSLGIILGIWSIVSTLMVGKNRFEST